MGQLIQLDYRYWLGTSMTSEAYEAYVPHMLHDWFPVVTPETTERVLAAERRLAAFRASVANTPALRWCLNRAEGIASSNVEGIATTLRSMSLLESLRGKRSQATDDKDRLTLGSVLMNSHAVAIGARTDSDVTLEDITSLHRKLFTDTEQGFDSGRLRDEQVWIGSGNRTPAGAHFVPPPHDQVRPLMDDLVRYISDAARVAPVAKAAIVHTQFETIHPFTDGNGRVGRSLMHLVLRRDGLLPFAIPISAAIDARKGDYYQSLRLV